MGLREKLADLTQTGEEHGRAVSALATEFGHSIRPIVSAVELGRYTCLVYALDFEGMPEYELIAQLRHENVFAGTVFAHWLLAHGHLEKAEEVKAELGLLALYLDDRNNFLHIGVVQEGGRIYSKWGNQGLFDHEIFEVPISYGHNVSYFKPIVYGVGIELFMDFAEEQGVGFSAGDP